jgi:3-hydroxyacyl-[acyl-carrier-protein] dehydratase
MDTASRQARTTMPRATPQVTVDRWSATQTGASWSYKVGQELTVLRGHYPHQPIFPGVYSVESVCQAAERWLSTIRGCRAKLIGINRVRFQLPFMPEEELAGELTGQVTQVRAVISATCFNAGRPALVAKLVYSLE